MAFLVPCPNCGKRPSLEFRCGGEIRPRPAFSEVESMDHLGQYLYDRENPMGEQDEWWFHRAGCRKWFVVKRNTLSNLVVPEEGANG